MNERTKMNNRQVQEDPSFLLSLIFLILFLPGGILLVMGMNFLSAIPLFMMEGEGRVVHKMSRSGENSGLWVQLEDGAELRLPPTGIWEDIHLRDEITKRKYSVIYTINDVDHNMATKIASNSLVFVLVLWLLAIIVVPLDWVTKFDFYHMSSETAIRFLFGVNCVSMGGMLLSIVTHLWGYTHHQTISTVVWIGVLSIVVPFYLVLILAFLRRWIENVIVAPSLTWMPAFQRTVTHLSRMEQLLLGLGGGFGGLITLSLVVPSPFSPVLSLSLILSAVSIWGYTVLMLVTGHFRWTYLDWVLTHPLPADHWAAMLEAAKRHESSAIPPLVDALRKTAGRDHDRIVTTFISLGDTRTLSPLLDLLDETPSYAQHPLKKAVQTACNAIHAVTFGTVPNSQFDPHHTLADYDFSHRALPLQRLTRIGIGTSDYHFAQVERFLTYAVKHYRTTDAQKACHC